ncbi:MAG: amidohydrolase family protein [Verrucomicrobiota bacterium]
MRFKSSSLTRLLLVMAALTPGFAAAGQSLLLTNAVVHTVSGPVLPHGSVLVVNGRIQDVLAEAPAVPANAVVEDLKGAHLYPGLVALDTGIGLTEIDAVRATQDTTEVGQYHPEVESWIAVNPDSELIPVTRANGIAVFEAVPGGGVVAGQSALLWTAGWTWEGMLLRAPAALHVFWPSMDLDLTPKALSPDPAKWKSAENQAKERAVKQRGLMDFFEEALAYERAKAAAVKKLSPAPQLVPAWEAMLPYVRGERPVVVHANELRQIRAAANWSTNGVRVVLAGGRDAVAAAALLASNNIPVIYEQIFVRPARDTESYDANFSAPGRLRRAGVKVVFGVGPNSASAWYVRNLPYAAAQAVAFGLDPDEALKGITLYPAEILGAADRLGSIERGKSGTLFVADGDVLDLRTRVMRMWIEGKEVSLESRHTRLYEKYRNRPLPGAP